MQRLWAHEYREPCTGRLLHRNFDGSQEALLRRFRTMSCQLKAVYVDLGYFRTVRRRALRRLSSHSINGRHPTAYFQNIKPLMTWNVHGLRLRKMRQGENIIYAASRRLRCSDDVIGGGKRQLTRSRRNIDQPDCYRPKPQRVKNGSFQNYLGQLSNNPLTRGLEHEPQMPGRCLAP